MNTIKTTAAMIAATVGLVAADPAAPVVAKEAPITIEKVGKGHDVVRVGDKPFTKLVTRDANGKHRAKPVLYPIYGLDGDPLVPPALRIDKGAEAGNSAGEKGKAIWGKAAKWVNYQNGDAGFAIFDHPTNPRHPSGNSIRRSERVRAHWTVRA